MSGVAVNPTPALLYTTPAVIEVRVRDVLSPAERTDADDGDAMWGEERVADRLVLDEISLASNGGMSTASLHYELGQYGADYAQVPAEKAKLPRPGAIVRIVERVPAEGEAEEDTEVEWFRGHLAMDGIMIQGSPEAEQRAATAYGPELRLANKAVTGAWYPRPATDDLALAGGAPSIARSCIFATDQPVVFNAGGLPNADPRPVVLYKTIYAEIGMWAPTPKGHMFAAPERKVIVNGTQLFRAVHWTAFMAVESLFEWFDGGDVLSMNVAAAEETLGDTPIGEVDVDGMSLLEALRAVLEPVGFGFCVMPWTDDYGLHKLVVYTQGRSWSPIEQAGPLLAEAGETISSEVASRGEVQRLHFVRDNHNVRNDITVYGEPRRVQVSLEFTSDAATRDLWPAWHTTEHPIPQIGDTGTVCAITTTEDERERILSRYNPDGAEFHKYRHVWRSFCWNEDGSLSEFANDGGTPIIPDLTKLGIGVSVRDEVVYHARVPRPIGPTITYDDDSQVKQRPAEVWLVVGDARVQVPAMVWPDRAGFTLTPPLPLLTAQREDVDVWRPFQKTPEIDPNDTLRDKSYLQLLRNTLEATGTTMTLQIVGTIEDDTCAKGHAPHDPASSWPLAARRVIRAGRRFRKYDYVGDPDGETNTIDDTAKAQAYAESVRQATDDQMGHGSLLLRTLSRKYLPGRAMMQTHPLGRWVELSVHGGDRYRPSIVQSVRWRFTPTPTTELVLESPLLAIT